MSACVLCPLTEGQTPISACQTCPSCGGLEIDPTLGKASILCHKVIQIGSEYLARVRLEARHAPRPYANKTPIRVVMTTHVASVPAEMPLPQLAEFFLENGVSGAPVIDGAAHPIGMVSKTDLVRAWHQEKSAKREGAASPLRAEIREIMNPIVTVLHEDTSIGRAASILVSEGIHRAPVVDDQGRVIGLLSSTDILRWLALFSGELPEP